MKTKKFLSLVLLSAIVMSCLGVSTEAAEWRGGVVTYAVDATGSFNMDVPANTTVKANSSFPLEVGEVVTIKATYSPFSASVDFGLIAPDNLFEYSARDCAPQPLKLSIHSGGIEHPCRCR